MLQILSKPGRAAPPTVHIHYIDFYSSTNRKYWGKELEKIFSSDSYKYHMLTSHQLVGLCLYLFVRPHLVPHIR